MNVSFATEQGFQGLKDQIDNSKKWIKLWQQKFVEENGRAPKDADIVKFPRVVARKRKLQKLEEAIKDNCEKSDPTDDDVDRKGHWAKKIACVAESPLQMSERTKQWNGEARNNFELNGSEILSTPSSARRKLYAVNGTPPQAAKKLVLKVDLTPKRTNLALESTPKKRNRTPSVNISTAVAPSPKIFTPYSPTEIKQSSCCNEDRVNIGMADLASTSTSTRKKLWETPQSEDCEKVEGIDEAFHIGYKNNAIGTPSTDRSYSIAASNRVLVLKSNKGAKCKSANGSLRRRRTKEKFTALSPVSTFQWEKALSRTPSKKNDHASSPNHFVSTTLPVEGSQASKALFVDEPVSQNFADTKGFSSNSLFSSEDSHEKQNQLSVGVSSSKIRDCNKSVEKYVAGSAFSEISTNFIRHDLKRKWKQKRSARTATSDSLKKTHLDILARYSDDKLDGDSSNLCSWTGDMLGFVLTKIEDVQEDSVSVELAAEANSTKAMPLSKSNYSRQDFCDSESWKDAPLCSGHQLPCILRTVNKSTKNKGRKYYACSVGFSVQYSARRNSTPMGCNFFLWKADFSKCVSKELKNICSRTDFEKARINELRDIWKKCTTDKLKQQLRLKGMPTTGKKDELVNRLIEDSLLEFRQSSHYCESYLKDHRPYTTENRASGKENGDFQSIEISKSQWAWVEKLRADIFKFPSFCGEQEWAIRRILAGKSTLVVQATGSGKSLCYQVPAYFLTGITIVICPLISLMEDQLQALPPSLPGAILCGKKTGVEMAKTLNALRAGHIKVLFISPERLFTASFQRIFRESSLIPEISLVCIDEAHCISEWSHNFRSSFLRMGEFIRSKSDSGQHLPTVENGQDFRLNARCVLALTATATPKVIRDIQDCIKIPMEGIHVSSHKRGNLFQRAQFLAADSRLLRITQLLQKGGECENASAIIYINTRNEAEIVAQRLSADHISCKAYHAGMSSSDRSKVQRGFMEGNIRVVVATSAFGMGVNKSDIGAIIHFGMPRSIEAYVQGIGRAGRDGASAKCYTFFDDQDAFRLYSLSFSNFVEKSTLTKIIMYLTSQLTTHQFPLEIETLAAQWDLSASTLETIFAYLSMKPFSKIKLLPSRHTSVVVGFVQSKKQFYSSKRIFKEIRRLGMRLKEDAVRLNVALLAEGMSISIDSVIKDLFDLRDEGYITLEFSRLCVMCQLNALNGSEDSTSATIEVLVNQLWEKINQVQENQTQKITGAFTLMGLLSDIKSLPANVRTSVEYFCKNSEVSIENHTASEGGALYPAAAHYLDNYFEGDGDKSNAENVIPVPFRKYDSDSKKLLLSDLRSLLSDQVFREEHVLTSLVAARIFHGIPSPLFPVSYWNSNSLWGARSSYCFIDTLRLSDEILFEMRRRTASMKENE